MNDEKKPFPNDSGKTKSVPGNEPEIFVDRIDQRIEYLKNEFIERIESLHREILCRIDSVDYCLPFLKISFSRIQGEGLFALRSFNLGNIICRATGEILNSPTYISIELRRDNHFEPISIVEGPDNINAIGKVNHSCDPNSYVEYDERNGFLLLKALREIPVYEEITIDYRRTETKMAHPFKCNCRSLNCGNYIKGKED